MESSVIRRLLVLLAVVAICFLVVDRAAGYALNNLVKQSGFRFSELYAGGHQADVLVLGNSRAVNAFYAPEMEKKLEQSVFNLGYNGMSMELCEVVLLDYLDHNERPSIVILEVTNLNVSNGLLKDFKLFSGMSFRIAELLRRDESVLYNASKLTHLYRFNSELFLRTLVYLNGDDQSWINSGSISEAFGESAHFDDETFKEAYPVHGANWEALIRILAVCLERNIEVRLVASPYLPVYRNAMTEYDASKAGFIERLEGRAGIFDFTLALGDYKDFADAIHINRRGSDRLLEMMIEDGVFDL
jgi:hypothetical protein